MSDGVVIIEGEDAMKHFHMCQVIAALRIETRTGMTSRTNWLRASQKWFGIKARTKVAALAAMEDLYEETYGKRYGAIEKPE